MFDDMKLNMKFIFRILIVVISVLSILFSFLFNPYAYIYLHTYNAILTLPIFVIIFKFTKDKLFKNEDYQTVTFNLIDYCLVLLNIASLILGLFFMEYKFWQKEFYTVDNVFSIIVLPLMVTIDFAFFVEKGLYKLYFIPYSIISLFVYFVVIIVRILIVRGNDSILSIYWSKYYPYVFLNFDNVNIGLVLTSVFCLLIGVLSIAIGCYYAKCKTYEITVND